MVSHCYGLDTYDAARRGIDWVDPQLDEVLSIVNRGARDHHSGGRTKMDGWDKTQVREQNVSDLCLLEEQNLVEIEWPQRRGIFGDCLSVIQLWCEVKDRQVLEAPDGVGDHTDE